MLMGYEGCSGSSGVGVGGGDRMNHDLDCTVSDLRLKWICSEMNNETKQFQHMIYPYMMLWVHDESSLHMECGPMLAALKAISWANNENKIGVVRRLVYGEPIEQDIKIVDEDTMGEMKKQAKNNKEKERQLDQVATQRQLDGSNNVNELMRMPEILVLGPNVEMLMYCKTCMELQRVVEERKLKLTFVKNRDEFHQYLFSRSFLTDNVCQGALVAYNLILCGLYERVDGMTGFPEGRPGHTNSAGHGDDSQIFDTEFLSD